MKKIHKSNNEGKTVTKRSIMYWVKKENFSEYEKIKHELLIIMLKKQWKLVLNMILRLF